MAVWTFLHRQGLGHKKPTQRAGPASLIAPLFA